MNFLLDIIDAPLLDTTIVKIDDTYWLFGCTASKEEKGFDMHIFYSDKLLGPYIKHPANPLRTGLDGTRSAGNCFEVDGVWYRPMQNCERQYGESITVYKIKALSKSAFEEEHI